MGRTDPSDVLTRPARRPDQVIRYGPEPGQIADLRIPPGWGTHGGGRAGTAVLVLLLHGGFWRAAYDRTHTGPMSAALADEGYLVCAPEFRRIGPPDAGVAAGAGSSGAGAGPGAAGEAGGAGGWPGTFDDVAAAVDALPGLVGSAVPGPPGGWRVVLAGHSAGGHLALWAAARHRLAPGLPWHADPDPRLAGVVALAPVSDLAACYRDRLGRNAAGDLLGGGPAQQPGRYAAADPAALLPLGIPVQIVHGSDDGTVPVGMSRRFAAQARAAGDEVSLRELPGMGHFDVIDPVSPAWPEVVRAFHAVGHGPGVFVLCDRVLLCLLHAFRTG